MQEYAASAPAQVFDAARERVEAAVAWLSDSPAGRLDHGRLESELDERGREVLRLLFQGHLDLRAVREARRLDVAGVDETAARTRVEENHQRSLATVFGGVTVTRMAYRAPGAVNLHPADLLLNLPEEKHSHGLRRLAAIESARGSFEAAGEAIRRVTGAGLGKRQAEQLARAAAADVDGFYGAHRPGSSPQTGVLVLSFDGKGIVMVPGALREATAKAAAASGRKLATRLSPGEKRGRKRMAEIAAVYGAVPVPRTAADIIAPPGHAGDQPRSRGPAARGKWLTASVTDGIPEVIAAGFGEAHRRDPGHRRTWVALADGNAQQIEAIHAEARQRDVAVTIVCDFVHVLEYLWQAAWCFYYEGDPGAEAWVAAQAVKILQSKAGTVAAAIRRKATLGGYSPAERKNADRCASYLTSKKPCLDYATALQQGWPAATGIIEGACRHIVKDRMDITGARWGLDSAEAILKLRTLTSNGDFDAYWNYHLRQEQHRVHHARYRNGLELAA